MDDVKQQEKDPEVIPARYPPIGNHAYASVAAWLEKVRFRRCLFGGVSEVDVWKKIEELNALYEAALTAERARYDTLLEMLQEKAGEENS